MLTIEPKYINLKNSNLAGFKKQVPRGVICQNGLA